MKTSRPVVFAILIGASGLFGPSPVHADLCGTPPPKKLIERSSIIFKGMIMSFVNAPREVVGANGISYKVRRYQATFLVLKVWKGEIARNDRIKIDTGTPNIAGASWEGKV